MTAARTAEHFLGFETDFFSQDGLPEENVQMIFTSNSRPTSQALDKSILEYWKHHKGTGQFDGNRVRFEGLRYNRKDKSRTVSYSYEKYRTYFFFTRNKIAKTYHPRLLGAYLIIMTKDGMVPIGLRTQGENLPGWWNIAPAGYVDIKRISHSNQWQSETFWSTAARELEEELSVPEKLDRSKIKLIGVFSSFATNWDVDATMISHAGYDSKEIGLRGSEHRKIRFIEASEASLKKELQKLAEKHESRGYLSANIALLLRHLYGLDDYRLTMEEVAKRFR